MGRTSQQEKESSHVNHSFIFRCQYRISYIIFALNQNCSNTISNTLMMDVWCPPGRGKILHLLHSIFQLEFEICMVNLLLYFFNFINQNATADFVRKRLLKRLISGHHLCRQAQDRHCLQLSVASALPTFHESSTLPSLEHQKLYYYNS